MANNLNTNSQDLKDLSRTLFLFISFVSQILLLSLTNNMWNFLFLDPILLGQENLSQGLITRLSAVHCELNYIN